MAAKVLRGKSPKMPASYSQKLTDLVGRMLSFDSKKRPTVGQILQQRFIRDRIKIFLQKQRPSSGKKSNSSRKSDIKANVPKITQALKPHQEKDEKQNVPMQCIDTMFVEVGTMRHENEQITRPSQNLGVVETVKAKDFHMNRFLSEGARQMIDNEKNSVNSNSPVTYIVQKNVKPEEVDTYRF